MTLRRRRVRVIFAACGLALAGAVAALACSSDPAVEDKYDPIARANKKPPETGDDPDSEAPGRSPDDDAGPVEAATDEDSGPDPNADAGACVGKADGFNWNAADKLARCCKGMPVRVTSNTNCGTCGAKCAAGFKCTTNPDYAGRYTCTCDYYNSGCNVTYAAGSTCYNDLCQCMGKCNGGGTCFNGSGENYCYYP
jgi:hypothetical protein